MRPIPSYSPSPSTADSEPAWLPWVILSISILLCIIAFAIYYFNVFKQGPQLVWYDLGEAASDVESGEIAEKSMATLKKILEGRVLYFNHEDFDEREPKECAICFEDFDGQEICGSLVKCNHTFHKSCVTTWLSLNPTCPICRTYV